MQSPSREDIAVALFALLQAVPGIKYASRRPTTNENANAKPALYIGSPEERYEYPNGTATPPLVTLDFQVYLYIDAGEDPNVIPDTLLNTLLDNIEAALAGQASNNFFQTLGGIVNHAWIEGSVHRVPGWLDGQGMALFTISVLVPAGY